MKYTFIPASRNVATMVTNKSKQYFVRDSYTLRLSAIAECIGSQVISFT